MTAPDILERVRRIRPDASAPVVSASDPSSAALLERILATDLDTRPARTVGRVISAIAALAAIGLVAASLLVPNGPSATAQVVKAVRTSVEVGSGSASMRVTSTLDGLPNNGTVALAWNGNDESYLFNFPQQSGQIETRVVSGRVLEKVGAGQWTEVGTSTPKTAQLTQAVSSLERLSARISFEYIGIGHGLRHFRAQGDLTPLDSVDAGFVFGTNGAPEATTTSLEVWVGVDDDLIYRVRTAFRGTTDGHFVEAVAVTELNLSATVSIVDPLAGS